MGYIIHEGLQGRHLLFDSGMIRESLSQDSRRYAAAPSQTRRATQAAFKTLTGLPTLQQKREFVSTLQDDVRHLLIYFYFDFLNRFMQRLSPTLH